MSELTHNDRLTKKLPAATAALGITVVGLEDFPNTGRIYDAMSGAALEFSKLTPTIALRAIGRGTPYLKQGTPPATPKSKS